MLLPSQETLEATDAEVFQELLRFAQQSHRPPAPRAAGLPEFAGCQRVPTGLVLAGGVNSADHCHTFPRLAAFLRQHGCYAALLHPHSLGKVPGDAIGEVLRQLSGMAASKAEHMDALRQWYQDETGAGRQQAAAAAGGEAAAAPGGDQQARGLRQRPAAAAAAGCATAAQLASRQRPLVVIVEGTESVDEKCLRDFILTASEVSPGSGCGGDHWPRDPAQPGLPAARTSAAATASQQRPQCRPCSRTKTCR